eukprot:CAMPEP_0181489986 /NCGR_PEP_ID=MMETSP1110-20121109/49302_1 /TAXON_ID=174948 /ORGANISM="Symbiodinium sp., Strain CCMP421" /LENGTH=90 /DNA_ID=CAMNT_0023616911 /DNA_START=122 /DNA_END=391 /DNA_ORIENTATION=-
MTETASFDEEIQEALSGSSPRSSMCSQESEEAPSPYQVCLSPNRLLHDMHVQDLQDFMSLIDSAPGNLDSAVQCKRMMMLRDRMKQQSAY